MLRGSSRALLWTTRNASFMLPRSRQLASLRILGTSSLAIREAQTPSLLLQARQPVALIEKSLSVHQIWRRTATSNTKDPKSEPLAKSPKDPAGATTSTTRGIFSEVGEKPSETDSQHVIPPRSGGAVTGALRGDLKAIKDTFALRTVPREAYVLGFAGLIPYVTTSLATVWCAWDVHYAHEHGTGFIISEESAAWLLTYLEPLQVGYGAVILSFLGAIHWGLEWAKYGGTFGYRRYSIGVIAPAIAWPTVLLPYEYALISQFLGFTYLYYADAAATTRGWAPPWYGTYRFVLTFMAGAAIVISLVGKSEVSDVMQRRSMGVGSVTDPTDKIVSGVTEGDKRLAKYETEKAKIMDKKEEERKEEEERKRKEEEDQKKKEKAEKKSEDKKDKDGDDADENKSDDDSEEDSNDSSDSK